MGFWVSEWLAFSFVFPLLLCSQQMNQKRSPFDICHSPTVDSFSGSESYSKISGEVERSAAGFTATWAAKGIVKDGG